MSASMAPNNGGYLRRWLLSTAPVIILKSSRRHPSHFRYHRERRHQNQSNARFGRFMRPINGLLTIMIVGVLIALGSPASSHDFSIGVSSSNTTLPLTRVTAEGKTVDDSCLRVPVSHPLTTNE